MKMFTYPQCNLYIALSFIINTTKAGRTPGLLAKHINLDRRESFLSIEQPSIVILPLLWKVGYRLPDKFIAALWNQVSHTVTLKGITTIGIVEESYYIEKHMIEQPDYITEIT